MATLDIALDYAMELDFERRDMLIDILKKRQIEERRDQIARDAEISMAEYRAGMYKPMTAEEVIKHLHEVMESGEDEI